MMVWRIAGSANSATRLASDICRADVARSRFGSRTVTATRTASAAPMLPTIISVVRQPKWSARNPPSTIASVAPSAIPQE